MEKEVRDTDHDLKKEAIHIIIYILIQKELSFHTHTLKN